MKVGYDYTGVGVVFLCHDGEGNVLLNKRSVNCRDEHGRWDIGGGALEFGGNVIETLKREIKEEFCTDVLDYEYLGFRNVLREHNGRKTHWLILDYKVLIEKNKVKIGEPHKFDELKWFKFPEFPEPMHSQFPTFFEKNKEKILLK
jgi:8-oxo-dGTP diphosphatase